MSTHATLIFEQPHVEARIYLHYDGYPSNVKDLLEDFFEWNEYAFKEGTRYNDAAYLAARFVRFFTDTEGYDGLGIGIGNKDDIGYVYHVKTDNTGHRPIVEYTEDYH